MSFGSPPRRTAASVRRSDHSRHTEQRTCAPLASRARRELRKAGNAPAIRIATYILIADGPLADGATAIVSDAAESAIGDPTIAWHLLEAAPAIIADRNAPFLLIVNRGRQGAQGVCQSALDSLHIQIEAFRDGLVGQIIDAVRPENRAGRLRESLNSFTEAAKARRVRRLKYRLPMMTRGMPTSSSMRPRRPDKGPGFGENRENFRRSHWDSPRQASSWLLPPSLHIRFVRLHCLAPSITKQAWGSAHDRGTYNRGERAEGVSNQLTRKTSPLPASRNRSTRAPSQ